MELVITQSRGGQNKGAKNGAGGRKTGKTRVNFVYSLTFESRQFPRAITYDDDLYSFFFSKGAGPHVTFSD